MVQLLRTHRDEVAEGGGSGASLLVSAGHFLFTRRNVLFPVVLLAAGLGTVPVLAGGSTPADHLLDAAGFLVALGGQLLRVLVIGLQYITRGGQGGRIWANTLVEGGVFAHTRNPLYLGNLLILIGLAIVHNGWAMYLVALPFFVFAYTAMVRSEESYLFERFGEDYRRYVERVPRFWPTMRGWQDTLRDHRFNWLKVLRKEYGTPFAWGTGFLLLLLWEHRSPQADPIGTTERDAIVISWAVLALAYIIIRRLKLTHRLGRD